MPRRPAQRATPRAPAALARVASCAPGVEPLLAAEIQALGLPAQLVAGGVSTRGDLAAAVRLNLWLRTATRVLARVGEVRATSFAALVHEASQLPFENVLAPGVPVALRVTCRKSRLYHSAAVAERLHVAIQERVGRPVARVEPAAESDDDATPPAQLLLARFQDDVCTVSADTSGALLHQRGYRTRPSRAPLRETLAAALFLSAGYSADAPFVDPLCGSGTLAIEAALIARRRAPGIARAFALQRWPSFDAVGFARLVEAARAQELPRAPRTISASDADADAIAACRENAARAGVEGDLAIERRELADLPAAGVAPGLCATNPPYGVRVGAAEGDLARLWRELGDRSRKSLRGWSLAVVSPDPRLARAAAVQWQPLLRTQNGGIPVELLRAQL
ncbi:MAG: RNA methyltransferase [Myxococcales bacterium]